MQHCLMWIQREYNKSCSSSDKLADGHLLFNYSMYKVYFMIMFDVYNNCVVISMDIYYENMRHWIQQISFKLYDAIYYINNPK